MRLAVVGIGLALVMAAADRALPPDMGRLDDASTLAVDREGRLLRAFTTERGAWRLPAEPAALAPLYRDMLLAYEDRRFDWHWGVDPLALVRAAVQMAAAGEVVSGASTVTMQTARLLVPRERTVGAKPIEMARAVQLELRHGKDDILGFYLTLAPYGGNLEGVRAASLAYFGKEPANLTPGQAALLVALPQSPERLRPDRNPAAARAARDKVLDLMAARGVLSAEQAAEAKAEAVPTARLPLPFDAPHLARALAGDGAGGGTVRTTVDGELQAAVERMARAALPALDPRASVAALVIETGSRAVRAYVGAPDFFDHARAGQVDMVRAVRSPGSTLKPFIYGMAFDDLPIHPETVVADRPASFGGYRPENFRRAYHGEVTVREALQKSLNVPAVEVLEAVGPVRFAQRLGEVGAMLRFGGRDDGPPGLPVALGGVGLTLWDLATLYAGLADGGQVKPLRLTEDAPDGDAVPVVGAAAAWQLARILEDAPPPADYVAARNARRGRPVAFKTGTSYGFRDAWAVGYDGRHTVAVWVGRPDGTPSPGQYGLETAAPILFEIFGLLPPGPPPMPGAAPEGVVDAATAELPQALRRFGRAARAPTNIVEASPETLRIAFPPDGALIELVREDGAPLPLTLAAQGGVKPLTWLVNGRPVDTPPHRRSASWIPDGAGFVQVTVIDGAGASASAEARLR